MDEKPKSFINRPFLCSEFQSVSRIVKIVHSVIMQSPKHTFEIGFFFHVVAYCVTTTTSQYSYRESTLNLKNSGKTNLPPSSLHRKLTLSKILLYWQKEETFYIWLGFFIAWLEIKITFLSSYTYIFEKRKKTLSILFFD